jgi:hypothetical protein
MTGSSGWRSEADGVVGVLAIRGGRHAIEVIDVLRKTEAPVNVFEIGL